MSTNKRRCGFDPYNLCLGALLLIMLSPGMAFSEPSESAVTHANRADADFLLQGEFIGTIALEPSKFRPVALQIRSNGEGNFEAAQYVGGFPDARRNRTPPVSLTGKRTDDFLVLSGGPWVVIVHPDHCLLIDPDGTRVGRLERAHRQSPTIGAAPPKNAIVLFDGTNTDQFLNGRLTEEGLLMQGADAKPMFQDFNLHLEFMLPYMPVAAGQGRANSGIYLQRRYEVQILDSFAIEPGNNGCGSLYRFREPDANMCYPPLTWQTYEIAFTSPRWASDETKVSNARISVWHNGVRIHKDVELPNKTGAGQLEGVNLLPIRFQDHGAPVRFRNIWLIDRGAVLPGRFPIDRKATGNKEG